MTEKAVCGSPQCLVDRLEETFRSSHEQSKTFIKELIELNIKGLDTRLAGIEAKVDKHVDRVHDLETRVIVLETGFGKEGIDQKIIGIIDAHETIKWAKRLRNNATKIMIVVTAAIMLGAGAYFLFIYDTHGRPTEYPAMQQQR